jgi:hypothetical protein
MGLTPDSSQARCLSETVLVERTPMASRSPSISVNKLLFVVELSA